MKKKIKQCIALFVLALTGTATAQTQLSAWQIGGADKINFTGAIPVKTGPSLPSASEYNSIADNAGNTLFYVTNGQIYNASNALIGTLPNLYTHTEIAIVPNPGNLTNPCQKKYYIVFPHLNSSLVSTMGYAEVNMNANSGAGSYTLMSTNLGNLGNPVNPMAVSKVNSLGKRYLYFLGTTNYNISICEITATGITPLNVSAYNAPSLVITQCYEMELTNAGDKLAFVNSAGAAGKEIIIVPINPLTGLNAGTASVTSTTGTVNGLEFNNAGTQLYFSKPGSGVYIKTVGSAATPTLVAGTTAMGVGMLEKSYNGNEIICASTTQIRGINTTTGVLNPAWTINYALPNNTSASGTIMIMPDQIDGENYAQPATNLVSAFTSALSFCAGAPITVNGSASYGTVNGSIVPNIISNYVWTVVECDAAGTPLATATEWWSPWGTGNPGTYTIPSAASGGPTMTCGKYYKVKLAVQNACVPWAESAKIIYINCPPSFKLKGSTSKICTGDFALLNATMNAGNSSTYTLNWTPISPAGPSIYNGPLASVTVSPTVPTTYLATVTDNVTGCSSIMQWYVNVVNNDPTFSLNINTIPATYFTMALSANDPYGYNNSGFYYSLFIEELDGVGNPYYQDNGTDCWWNYPNQETFQGYASTGTGTFSQSGWGACPAPAGQFLYNHTYRITRGVWNDQCTYRQFAMIITTVKSGNGHTVEAVEDPNAPDYGALSLANAVNHQGEENAIAIYPNPSNGLYTIELADYTDASIEVYNVLGKKVKTVQQTATKTTVDLTGYPKGVYFVNIHSNGELISKKIILE